MVMLRTLEEFLDETKVLYDCGRYRIYPPQHPSQIAPEPPAKRPAAIEILRRQFAEEVESIARLRRRAETARYAQFREELGAIARQEERHAQRLVRRIHELGGKVPKVALGSASGAANWEALGGDREREMRCCDDLAEAIALTKDLDAETAELLEDILRDERKHLHALTEMQMRSDPQS